jgi:3-dehydrosphinganine reductase
VWGIPSYVFYTFVAIGGILLLVLLVLELVLLPRKRSKNHREELLQHAIITGGSSGIGYSVAKELIVQKCPCITLLARNMEKLKEAKAALETFRDSDPSKGWSTIIQIYSVDVSNPDQVAKAAKDICSSESVVNPTMLLNIAGISSAKEFIHTDYNEFQRLMNINYLGSAYVTRAFLPYMLTKTTYPKPPRAIVFTSSQAGQLGVYGYTAYSASKFALRGLAEALQSELARDNVSVKIAFPPDTNTPGFEQEQIDKPEETRLISETSGLFQPDSIAKTMIKKVLSDRPPFQVYFGLDGWMLATLTAGMGHAHTITETLCEVFLMGLFRFISLFYLMDFRRIIRKTGEKKK